MVPGLQLQADSDTDVFTFGRPDEGVRTFSAIPAMTTLSLAPMSVPMPPRHDPKASDQMSGSM